jgi:ADP-ribose pyrophosphatase
VKELSLNYGASDVEVTRQETVFQGYFRMDALTLRHKRFDGSWTNNIRRELFQRGDAVAVLPWDVKEDRVILIEQFRPGAIRGSDSPWMLEAIAGVVEEGESDEAVAHREALEEAGYTMDALLPITSYYPSPGACSEQIRLFIGRLTSAAIGEVRGVETENEDILVHSVAREEAIALLDAGKINNGLTIIALHWLARHGDRLRSDWLSE